MEIKKIKSGGYIDYLLTIESKQELKRIIKRYNLSLWQVKEFIQILAENKRIENIFLCIEKKNNKYNYFLEY